MMDSVLLKLVRLIHNELNYLIRQPLFWLACVLVPAVGYLFTTGLTTDAPSFIVQVQLKYVALVMLILPVYMGGMLPNVFLREQNSAMVELVNATPTTALQRTLAKIFGFILSTWLVFAFTFLFIGLVAFFTSSTQAMNELIYLELLIDWARFSLLILLPTVLGYVAIGLWMAKWQTSVFSFYAFSLVVLVCYLVLASLTGNPILAGSAIASESLYQWALWLDPLGFTPLFTEFTKVEMVSSVGVLTSSTTMFTFNRLGVFVGVLLLIAACLRTSDDKTELSRKRSSGKGSTFKMTPSTEKVELKGTGSSPWVALFHKTLNSVCANKVTLLILLAWPFLIFNEVLSGLSYVEPFAEKSTNSLDAINRINSDVLPVFGSLLMALWSWQITGLFVSHQSHELIATTPIKNKTILAAQMGVGGVLVFVLLALTVLGCMVAELVGGSDVVVSIYVVEFSRIGLSLGLLVSLFISLQHIAQNRMTSSALIVALLVFKFTPISGRLGLTHTLWNIAGSPLQQSDHFWGSAGSDSVFVPYMVIWILVVSLCIVIANAVSHRGTFYGNKLLSFHFVKHPHKYWLGFGLAAVCVLMIFRLEQQLVAEKPLTYSHHREAWKAEYEHIYRHWLDKPAPVVEHIDANIKIEPTIGAGQFELRYRLRNKSEQGITSFLVSRYGNFESPTLFVELTNKGEGRAASNSNNIIEAGQVSGQNVVTLAQPLQPNETVTLVAKFELQQPKLWPATSQFYIKPEMTYLRGIPLLPVIGFQPEWMLRSAQLRAEYQLPEMPTLMPSERFSTHPYQLAWQRELAYKWATYSSKIQVPTGYKAIGPGELTRSEQVEAHTVFHFESDQPMRQIPSWFVVPVEADKTNENEWRITQQRVGDIITEVYVPSTQHVSDAQLKSAIEINQLGMADTLTWLSNEIKPYPHRQLRMFAIPNNGPTGFAMPQAMLIGYDVGFMALPTAEAVFDQRYRRAVHETAHQWFGHDIGNGISEDGAFLVESLAKYVELVMIEQRYGQEAKDALVKYEKRRFENQQRFYYGTEKGLVDATSPHQQYSRATIAFELLRTELGDEVILEALRLLWSQHGYPNEPATSMNFVAALKSVAGEVHYPLIEQALLKAPYVN